MKVKQPIQLDYDLGDPNCPTFEIGGTTNPNRYRNAKIPKARDPAFTTFEDILLVKALLATSMDPRCGTRQKGNTYWEMIWKHYHEYANMRSCILSLPPVIWPLSNINGPSFKGK